MTPQATTVLRHLQDHGSITNVEANAVHKIRSVSRRITEIARAGYIITKTRKVDATEQVYVRYALESHRLCQPSHDLRVGDRVRVVESMINEGATGVVIGFNPKGGLFNPVIVRFGSRGSDVVGTNTFYYKQRQLARV